MTSFFAELKRRNVFKVGVAYAIVAWLLIQVASIILPTFEAPGWVMRVFTFFIIMGFPLACFFAWAFELTPEGIKPSSQVSLEESITSETGRKLNVLIVGLLLGAFIGAGSFWMLNQEDTKSENLLDVEPAIQSSSVETDADLIETKITRIEESIDEGDWEAAYAVATEIEKSSPSEPLLIGLWSSFSSPYAITTNPAGAHVYRRAFNSMDNWEDLGTTPVESTRLPRGISVLRFELEGYEPVMRTQFTAEYGGKIINENITSLPVVVLDTKESLPKGMIRVSGWNENISGQQITLRDFFISQNEVTNREYKVFVDAGGYRRPEFWQYPIIRDGVEHSWEAAMALLVDRTGRSGPSTWEVGDYPEGQDDYPVSGVSWYEAAAYANFVKLELPTVHYWRRAFSEGDLNSLPWVMPASNLESTGPKPTNQDRGMTWTGAYDMAGNVREWTTNETGGRRYILGGGWNDPYYVGMDMGYAQPPLDRSETNGFRLISTRDDESVRTAALQPVSFAFDYNYLDEEPVSEETFRAYQRLFSYDRTPLNAQVGTKGSSQIWNRERITFDATYNNERMVLYLYLPATGSPPYQTVVYWPGLSFFLASIDDYPLEDFLIRDGRAVAFPVYKGIFERGDRTPFPGTSTVAWRDISVKWVNDLRRSIDYLETRADIDPGKFSYFGVSWGAGMAPLALRLEPRLRTAVLYVGGVFYIGALTTGRYLPEVDPATFLSGVKAPVLMLNGEFDSIVPLETSAKPFYELLGVSEPDKKHVIAPGGHFVPRNILIRESLDWLDKYLGPVN
jgi:dienelactone hydrolase